MRNFEERRAEILRRSEQRIQTRRRTVRYTLLCLPLIVCLAVAAVLLPQGLPPHDVEEGLPLREVAVRVQQPDTAYVKESTDVNRIAALSSALQEAMSDPVSEENTPATNRTAQDADILSGYQDPTVTNLTGAHTCATQVQTHPDTGYKRYIITFTTREGQTVTYRLDRTTLTETTTSRTVTLTKDTASALYTLIDQLT